MKAYGVVKVSFHELLTSVLNGVSDYFPTPATYSTKNIPRYKLKAGLVPEQIWRFWREKFILSVPRANNFLAVRPLA
jgi:hypothetical protein